MSASSNYADHEWRGLGAFFFANTLDRSDLARKLVRVSRPRNMPVVSSRDEVARLLNATTSHKHQAALSVAYGAGLRADEVAMLKARAVTSPLDKLGIFVPIEGLPDL